MDISSNAQASEAREGFSLAGEVQQQQQTPPQHGDRDGPLEKISSETQPDGANDIEKEGEKVSRAASQSKGRGDKDKDRGTSRLNDLTSPPPAYGEGKYRDRFYKIWRPKNPPAAPRASLDDAPILPLVNASWLSELLYLWINPMMTLGYQRPLQATDLWKMDENRTAAVLAKRFQDAYDKRQRAARAYNVRLDAGEIKPSLPRRLLWRMKRGSYKSREDRWRESKRQRASMFWTLSAVVGWFFWVGGLAKIIGDTSQLMGPLVSRNLIEFAQQRSAARSAGQAGPSIGRGIGDAVGLLILTCMASIFQHFFFYRSMASGALLRAALSTIVYEKSLVLSQQARVKHNNGKLMAHLSTDISRIDYACQWFSAVWTAPIQIAICAALLIVQIGPSALVGLALFALLVPLQSRVMSWQIATRKKSMKWTDARSKTLQELLASFSIIKYFTSENAYLKRISDIRRQELLGVWKISLIKAGNQSLALSLPTLSAVCAFLCYLGTGHTLNPAKLFTALSLFQLLRQPLMFLPRSLSASADAWNAMQRLQEVLEAETRVETSNVDPELPVAIQATNASFEWLTADPEGAGAQSKKERKKEKKDKEVAGDKSGAVTPVAREPFKVRNLNISIERGQLVAIVGSVGSGKSSILAGLIGEMKATSGDVKFGGKIAYCSQTAFIQNATLRDNVLFGQEWDEERYWECIEAACLLPDCLQLGDGDLTEIGERGINISGGQKQRVNVARALYFGADIVLFDDPLSALDAHVGQSIFDNAMIKMLKEKGKTVLLVTHALHVLSRCDYIYTVEDGHIVEDGPYAQLLEQKGPFSSLMLEYGGAKAEHDEEEAGAEEGVIEAGTSKAAAVSKEQKVEALDKSHQRQAAGTGKLEGRLIAQEKRVVGKIGWPVYKAYFIAGKYWITVPFIIGSSAVMQGAQVMVGLWLTYWENDRFNTGIGVYMGAYAAIGITQAIFTFILGTAISSMTYFASVGLHEASIRKIFFAPLSFFHSTPLGRILGVFGKDIDVTDNQLSDSFRMAAMIFGTVISSVVLVSIFFQYFLIAVVVVLVGYAHYWMRYRASSREIKRLDSMLRSLLYAHFSESLAGLPIIRAYGESKRFRKENAYYMDLEDRAYFLTAVNQRWLSIRIDALGSLMTFAIAIMAAVGVNGITPAQVGLVLSFCIGLTQSFGMVTRQTAEIENNMNGVERIAQYSSESLPQEAAHSIPGTEPSKEWPSQGEIIFDDVSMSYRPDLPPVLKHLSASIRPGEKIGIVGRTGAGKSSIMQALFRMVELSSGRILIDGIDVSKLGLNVLRSNIAIIPQDPQLFSGTIRTNLDPFNEHDDAALYSAMKRAYLVGDTSETKTGERHSGEKVSRYNLDTEIEDSGENLSVGERSLVSLARALVKDSKIVVLDEATASVDYETDAKIQATIERELVDKTLLCIAHRLRTILAYDRILVLEQGEILEFDTPHELFRKEGSSFHNMCIKSSITESDIVQAQKQRYRL